jgi:hypothetical protein
MKSYWLLLALWLTNSVPAATPGASGPRSPEIKPPASWAPLVSKPGAVTEKSVRADEIRWFQKHLLPVISKSWTGEPWREQALAFVEERFHYFQWRQSYEPWPDLKHNSADLLKAGCADPWVRIFAGWESGAADRYTDMLVAFEIIRDSGLDPALLRFAALPLISKGSRLTPERHSIILEVFTEWTAGLGSSPCYAGKDGDLLLRHIRKLPAFRLDWSTFQQRLDKGTNLPAWVLETLAGEAAIDRAWESRGSGWANTVSESGWKGFHRELEIARKHLMAAWQTRPDQPHAAALMIVVVMGDGAKRGENARLWFDRATAAYFDYDSAYHRYRQTLLPRWGGDYNTLLAFGLACVDSKRFDTFAPMCYFEILQQMSEELNDSAVVYRSPEVAPRVKALNAALLAAATTPEQKADRQSFIALDSWLTGDWDTGFAAAEALQGKPTKAINSKLKLLGVSRRKVLLDLALFSRAAGEPARQAEIKERQGNPTAATALWQNWAKQFTGDSAVKAAGEARLAAAQLGVDYAAGKWVTIPVNKPDGWDRVSGDWDAAQGSPLTAIGAGKGFFHCASYPFSPGPKFEMRVKYKLSGAKIAQLSLLQLHTGFLPTSNYSACSASAILSPKSFQASIGGNCGDRRTTDSIKIGNTSPEEVELYFRRSPEGITFVVNGQPIFENKDLTAGTPDWERGQIALGAHHLDKGLRVTVSSVEIHLLP